MYFDSSNNIAALHDTRLKTVTSVQSKGKTNVSMINRMGCID